MWRKWGEREAHRKRSRARSGSDWDRRACSRSDGVNPGRRREVQDWNSDSSGVRDRDGRWLLLVGAEDSDSEREERG